MVAIWGVVSPEGLASAATAITRASFTALDWFYVGTVTGLLLLCLWLGFGKHGTVRLGGPDDRPEFCGIPVNGKPHQPIESLLA